MAFSRASLALIDIAVVVLAALSLVTGLIYLSWLAYHLNWTYFIAAPLFLICEIGNFSLMAFSILGVMKARQPILEIAFSSHFAPAVDVFITTCGEPLELVKRTLLAALAIDYPYKIIYVLDDAGDHSLAALCKQYQVHYQHRLAREHRKAGNLNYGLAISRSDFIMTLDADQIPQPEIIKRLIPYFVDAHIGFVSTAQAFNLPKGDPWGNRDALFYQAMQVSKSHDMAAISCGSGVMYRRKALSSIGGFKTWSLVEDLYSSLSLHAQGWKSKYLKHAYTCGEAPTDVITHNTQRYQWALDSLRIFFWQNPLFKRGLSYVQKMHYFHFGLDYLVFGLCLPFILLFPAWTAFSKENVLNTAWTNYMIYRGIYYIALSLYNLVATAGYATFKAFQMHAGLFHIFFKAIFVALLSKERVPPYLVTSKKLQKLNFFTKMYAMWPHLLIMLASISAIVYLWVYPSADLWFNIVNIFWLLWVIALLSRYMLVAASGPIKN